MAFQVLRPRLNAELDRVRSERLAAKQAAMHSRLLAEKQVLSARLNSPTKEGTPLPLSPKSSAMILDGEDGQDVIIEDKTEDDSLKTADILTIPPPKAAGVSGLRLR